MAVFNPQIPDTQDPNWLGWSKSITQPSGDTSTGTMLSSIGEGVGEALKLADTSVKSVLEDQIYTQAKAVQQDYQSNLTKADDSIRLAQNRTGIAVGPGTNILNTPAFGGGGTGPADLKNLTYQVDGLGNARANGKLSETDYYMRLDTLAKDFRSRYPGYKEFIDNTFEKVTGVNAANKAITSTLQDINVALSNINQEKNKAITFLSRDDVAKATPRAGQALWMVQTGQISPSEGMAIGMEGLQQLGVSDRLKRQVEDGNNNRELVGQTADQWGRNHAFNSTYNNIQGFTIDTKGGSQKFEDYMRAHGPGTGNPIPAEDWLTLSQMVRANRDATKDNIWKDFNTPRFDLPGATKPQSYVQIVGEKKAREVLDAQLEWHNNVLGAIGTKDTELLNDIAQRNKMSVDNTVKNIYKEMPEALVIAGYNHAGGPNFAADMARRQSSLLMPFADKAKLKAITSMSVAQPNVRQYSSSNGLFSPTPTGTPYTLKKSLDDIKFNPNDSSSTPPSPRLIKSITELPQEIANPNLPDEGKIGLIQATFSSGNRGFIDSLKPDGTTKDGRPISGKMAAFTGMTSSDTLKEVQRLDKLYPDQKLWEQTKTWVGETFAQELFSRDLADLNGLGQTPGVKIGWDNERHQWQPKYTVPVREMDPFRQGDYITPDMKRHVDSTINRLNDGLRSVSNVYVMDGKDPNAGLLNMMKGLGINIEENTVPGQMMRAIGVSGAGSMKMNFNMEDIPSSGRLDDQRGSPASFLSNPAGVVPYRQQNAPVKLSVPNRGNPPVTIKRGMNLTDQNIISQSPPQDIPPGMSTEDFIRMTK